MSLLQTFVKEMAAAGATSAGAIANVPGSLMGGGAVDAEKAKLKRRKMFRRVMNMKESLGVDQDRTAFDAADVISKIDAAGKKASQDDDTTPFGLEDEDGNMVKVYVRNDQSEEFEKTLAAMLAGEDENDDGQNSSPEIAEVLFKLKDKFEIVNVEWPGIEGDVEEEQEVAGGDPLAAGGAEGAPADGAEGGEDPLAAGGEDPLGAEGGEAPLGGDMAPDESGAESALNQVIDMMKTDAEAKKAEAGAREAEAKAKEAEYAALAGAGRVRKEEQVYDMEQSKKRQKEEEQEAKQQAELARYQYQKAQDSEVRLSMEGAVPKNEPVAEKNQPISLEELTKLIMRNLSHQ